MGPSPFGEEHEELRRVVRSWVEAEMRPHLAEWEREADFPSELIRTAGRLGFLGLHMPESVGGQGGDYWSHVVFLEELGRVSGAIATAIAVQTDMATPPILQYGTPEQIQGYLRPALAGEKIGAIGITEPDTGSDVASIRTSAVKDGEEWVLSGSKMYITNGARADFVTLVARTGPPEPSPWSGISMFLVDTALPGFEVSSRLAKPGLRMSDTTLLHMDDVRLPPGSLLGEEGSGFPQIMWELQGERLAVAVYGVAGARGVLDAAIAHARSRTAFGRPIGSFQATSHRLADLATEIEAVEALVYECCDLWNRGVYATNEVAMAKLAAGRLAARAGDVAVQTMGGHGLVEGGYVGREWLGMRIARIGGGSDEVQLQILARSLGMT